MRVELAEHALNFAHQHIVFAAELGVKGGAADIGAVDDLPHGDPVVPLLAHQREERVDDETAAASRTPVRFLLRHHCFRF